MSDTGCVSKDGSTRRLLNLLIAAVTGCSVLWWLFVATMASFCIGSASECLGLANQVRPEQIAFAACGAVNLVAVVTWTKRYARFVSGPVLHLGNAVIALAIALKNLDPDGAGFEPGPFIVAAAIFVAIAILCFWILADEQRRTGAAKREFV